MDDVLIRWQQRGTLIRDGTAMPRYAGDEDLVSEELARRIVRSRKAAVVGTLAEVPVVGAVRPAKTALIVPETAPSGARRCQGATGHEGGDPGDVADAPDGVVLAGKEVADAVG